MKTIFKKLILVLALVVFPNIIFATGDITVSPTSLTIEEGKSATFTIKAVNTIGDVTIKSSDSNVAKINISEWETGMVEDGQTKTGTVTVSGISKGTAVITLTLDAATFDSEDLSGQTRKVNVTVKKYSTNNNLSDIKIDGESINDFSASNTTYSLSTDKGSINITATSEDGTAKIEGIGNKTLKYGVNKIEIKVTSETGAIKTYTLNVTRNDNRDTNNYLSSLSTDKGEITFNKETLNYKLEVEDTVDKIEIKATAESEKAKVAGTGSKTLKYGDNKIEIKVTAENETVKTYVINVNRKDNRSNDATLSELNIEELEIDFDKNTTKYDIEVDNDVESINIEAKTSSDKAKISGLGKKSLKVGKNTFTIKVTAENGKVKNYTLNITRSEDEESEIDKENETIEVISYTITFDSNGGSNCDPLTKKVEENGFIGSLCSPVREGYSFIGWYTSSIGGERITQDTKVTKNMTLYAQWTKLESKSKINVLLPIIIVLCVLLITCIVILIIRNNKQKNDNIL